MNYDRELKLVQKLLSNFSLDVHYIKAESSGFFVYPESQSLHESLHESLKKIWDHESLLKLLLNEFHPNTIYQIHDLFSCNYFIFQLPGDFESPLYAYIGPYTTKPISKERVRSIADSLQFHPAAMTYLEQFCLATPLISDEYPLRAILYTLGESIWGSLDNFSIQVVENPFLPNVDSLLSDQVASSAKDSVVDLEIAEERYKMELQLMEAVSLGQTHKAELYLSHLINQQYSSRITNTLRKSKIMF